VHNFIPKYLAILQLEMEDLEADIELIIDEYTQRKKNEEITEYVFLENLAVLKKQICGISSFKKIVQSIDPGNYPDIDAFIVDVKVRFKEKIDETGLGQAIYILIKRKIEKVYKYIHQPD
jgi:hypothetical protein